MIRAALVALTVAAATLGGCRSIDRTVGSLMGEPSIETPANPQPAQRFLTANDAVAVHAAPNGTSPIVGFLRLKEPVKQTGLESGYAFVSARDGDLEGWVDNGLLTTRQSPPAARQSAAPAAPAHKHAAAHPSAAEPATSEAETPAGTSSGDGDVAAGETAAPAPAPPHPPLTEAAAETEPAAAAIPAARPHPAEPEAEMLNPF